jgi:hypothetical protein
MDNNLQGVGSPPGLVERAKAMIVSPKAEWPKVSAEDSEVRDVFVSYVVPLAAIGPVASFIGGQLFGYGAFGFSMQPSLTFGLTTMVASYVLSLISIFLVSWIASFLAGKFGGQENFARAFKLCAYAFTAAWVVGIFGLIPALGVLGLLALYSLYVFYLGATPMVGVPEDKAAGYTAVTVIAAIVVNIVAGILVGSITGMFGAAASLAGSTSEPTTMEMDMGEYGQMRIEDNGDTQTMEIPGMGKVEVTKDGDVVTINGENFNAEIADPDAAADGEQ